jgi:hypothetical protein
MKFLQENIIGSTALIHNSVSDVIRAQNATHTTLYNTINTFNAVNFSKFLENVSK